MFFFLFQSRSSGGGTVKCHPFSTVSLAENARGVVREISPLVRGGETNQRRVGIWLLGCTGWVFSMVVLGGVTRLTRSGLSMTDWKFAGGLPPLTVEQWQMEFLKYQNSPEYKRCVEDRKMMVMKKKKKTSPVAMCFFVAMTAAQQKTSLLAYNGCRSFAG